MKRTLLIEVRETVTKKVQLVIGDDITEEQAQQIMKMEDTEYDIHTDEYATLSHLLGDDIFDSNGFEDVYIDIIEEKEGGEK